MKYKRGKGRKPRKQRKVFCMKKGNNKFSFRGGKKSPAMGFMYTKGGGDR